MIKMVPTRDNRKVRAGRCECGKQVISVCGQDAPCDCGRAYNSAGQELITDERAIEGTNAYWLNFR